jgi:hypothetical protein
VFIIFVKLNTSLLNILLPFLYQIKRVLVNILEIENKFTNLKEFLSENYSKRSKLLKISEFYSILLSSGNQNQFEAYVSEFIHSYFSWINDFEIRGLNPVRIESLINQLTDLKTIAFLQTHNSEIDSALSVLNDKLQQSKSWLRNNKNSGTKNIIYFPVLENNQSENEIGYLETLYIDIKNGENKFHITPAEAESDTQLQKQIEISWDIALKYCATLIKKIKPAHTVDLHFENRLGVYVGNSLGIALTLAFIEAILKHYNSPTIIKINGVIAVSGGIDNNSKVISTSKVIIEAKVETVFYSDAQIFCVPKIDEIWAEKKLLELKKINPERNLKIVGLADLEDILSRRNVVDIHKRNIVVRVFRYTLRKWKSIILAALLTLIFIFIFALDFDNNPVLFQQKGKLLSVQNKNGKMLWNVNLIFDPTVIGQDLTAGSRKIIDINGDGLNEILICEEDFGYDDNRRGRIVCFDNKKNVVWDYNFRDTVSTFRTWTNNYFISLIDTITIQKSKTVLLRARNEPNFPNAVFMLDLKSGKRLDSLNTLWNAGGITNSIIGDFNEDGKKELVLGGLNNGYECAVFFSVNLDKIKGQTPSKDRYVFKNIPNAILNNYILLPHTDYGKLMFRNNVVPYNTLFFDSKSKEFQVSTYEGLDNPILFHYRFDKNFNFLWVDCADNAQQQRDSLVAQGILRLPYTNTSEYFKILKDEIRYWDGTKFISIEESLK